MRGLEQLGPGQLRLHDRQSYHISQNVERDGNACPRRMNTAGRFLSYLALIECSSDATLVEMDLHSYQHDLKSPTPCRSRWLLHPDKARHLRTRESFLSRVSR